MPKRIMLSLLLASALISQRAAASQYPLDQAGAIIPAVEAPKLRRAGIRTTADFLVWGRTSDGRRLLAERSRLALEQVTAWVRLADLLRVRGIGPDVARLLTAVGVRTVSELRAADPDGTAVAVREINKKSHLSTNPPGAESIRYWVAQAATLPVILSFD